jgi:hypothetical protein
VEQGLFYRCKTLPIAVLALSRVGIQSKSSNG